VQGLSYYIRILRNSFIIFCIISIVAIFTNFIHPHRIPFIAEKPYEIFVPCPDSTGEIKEIGYDDFMRLIKESIIIDARGKEEYEHWHFNGAINIEYDYLSPVCPMKIKEIISMRRKLVLIYGDGEEPDSGKELAKELATRGIKNVYFLKNGVKELKR